MQRELGKRGNIGDVIFFTIYSLVTAVGLILVGYFMLQFAEGLEGSALQQTVVGNNSIQFIKDVSNNNIPGYFVTLFAFDIIGIIGTSFLITLSPIFWIVYVILIGFAVSLSAFSMMFYNRFSEVSNIAAYVEQQTMINYIFQYAPLITLIIGVISAIIIMAKVGPSTGGGQDI